jgi:hypothetical protein
LLTAALGFAVGVTLTGGIAVAATSSTGAVKACKTSHDVLDLATNSGHCPKGDTKVSVGARGARGAQGLRGVPGTPGQPGKDGKQGPGASTSSAQASPAGTIVDGPTIAVGTTGLSVLTHCQAGQQSRISLTGDPAFTITGTADEVGGTVNTAIEYGKGGLGGTHYQLAAGVSSLHLGGQGGEEAGLAMNIGQPAGFTTLEGTMLTLVGTSTFTVDFFMSLDGSDCQAVAQITPAG